MERSYLFVGVDADIQGFYTMLVERLIGWEVRHIHTRPLGTVSFQNGQRYDMDPRDWHECYVVELFPPAQEEMPTDLLEDAVLYLFRPAATEDARVLKALATQLREDTEAAKRWLVETLKTARIVWEHDCEQAAPVHMTQPTEEQSVAWAAAQEACEYPECEHEPCPGHKVCAEHRFTLWDMMSN
jgi:hypothetical protein